MILTDLLALVSRTFAWLLIATLVSTASFSTRCTYDAAYILANCSNRNIVSIPWWLHKKIITLDLSGNYFPVLKSRSFIGFNYINQLYLKHNSIQYLEDEALQDLVYLRVLDLSINLLSHLPTSALKYVSLSLTQLDLSGNRIQVIYKGAFKDLKNLKILELNGNSISRIDTGGLSGLSSLNVLKLRQNALCTLPCDVFSEFSSTVETAVRQWMCHCNLRWLRTWLNNTNQEVWNADGYFIRCNGPSIVKDKPLNSLLLDELECEVRMKLGSSTELLYKPDETTIANASIIQSDTASQSTESENLEAFLIATVVMASVAASFTISTVIACYRYHSTKKKRLKDNYDELDTRITDRVFYHRPQVNAQNSSSSCASGYLDVVSSRSSSPRDTPAEAGTDANPYAEIGEMCMAGESKTADE